MQSYLILSIIFLNIYKYRCELFSCRTNCSSNGTINDKCWHDALNYRSKELIEQLFSFSSLSVYVDAYQRYHPNELNNSIALLNQSLENHLINESINSRLNQSLFTQTKNLLLEFCQNLTSTPIESVEKFPSLSCSSSTCSADLMNYLVLFIICTILCSFILIICIVQTYQIRRQSILHITIQQNETLITSPSTVNNSINS